MRILIVDDDELSLAMLENSLIETGHEVETARDGLEAMEKLRQGACRMVISDWEMPRMNGEQLCQAIRSEVFNHDAGYVYVILLTSHGGTDYTVRGLSAGADDFIAKPFAPAELTARIRAGQRVLSLETRDVALFALAKLAESRDPETGAHLERMQSYSLVLARHLSKMNVTDEAGGPVNEEFVRLVYLTSPLHDIGKVGIPDSVLLKPGRLSDREFEIMKTHSAIGAETLDAALKKFPTARFLQMARDIAATHHERMDGSGYPARLAGEHIPLSGRIVALADVYDALTSRRVYKQAFNHEVAKAMILEESGTHFDPAVVQAFMDNEARFLEIRNRFSESQVIAA